MAATKKAIAQGEPIEMGGTTIVPIALTSYGSFGSRHDSGAEEDGGSTAGFSVPMGAYVTRDGYTRFEPNLVSLIAVGIPFVCVAGRALARVVKALKK